MNQAYSLFNLIGLGVKICCVRNDGKEIYIWYNIYMFFFFQKGNWRIRRGAYGGGGTKFQYLNFLQATVCKLFKLPRFTIFKILYWRGEWMMSRRVARSTEIRSYSYRISSLDRLMFICFQGSIGICNY